MNAIRIIIIALVIILVWVMWGFLTSGGGTELAGLLDAKIGSTLSKNVPASSTNENWAYSVWFSVDNWVDNAVKKIMTVENKNSDDTALEITLGRTENILQVTIYDKGGVKGPSCKIQNIPLQKWTHIIVSLDGKGVHIYRDGKIETTCTLDPDFVIAEHASEIKVSGGESATDKGFPGFLAKPTKYADSISPQQAWGKYKEGASSGGLFGFLSEYGFKLSVTKGGEDWTKLEI